MEVLWDKGKRRCNCYSQNKHRSRQNKKIVLGKHPSKEEWLNKYRHFHKIKREITQYIIFRRNLKISKYMPYLWDILFY